jgi:hypothetical protein
MAATVAGPRECGAFISGEGGLLEGAERLEGGHRSSSGDDQPGLVDHDGGVGSGDTEIDADSAQRVHLSSLVRGL